MNSNIIKALLSFVAFYIAMAFIFPVASGTVSTGYQTQKVSINIGSIGVVFVGAVMFAYVYGKLAKSRLDQGQTIFSAFLIVFTAIIIDAANWYLHGFFVGQGNQIFSIYLLVMFAVGGFIVIGGLSLGNRLANGKLEEGAH